jgi:hypothetical protein
MAAAVSVRADYDAAQLREQAKQSADAPIRPGACCRWSEKCPEETRELVAKALNELCIFSRFSLNARDIAEVLLSYTFVILARTRWRRGQSEANFSPENSLIHGKMQRILLVQSSIGRSSALET